MTSGISRLDVSQAEARGGCLRDGNTVEKPLVARGPTAGMSDEEHDRRAGSDRLGFGLGRDDRGLRRSRHIVIDEHGVVIEIAEDDVGLAVQIDITNGYSIAVPASAQVDARPERGGA